jgi:hypothetical protein
VQVIKEYCTNERKGDYYGLVLLSSYFTDELSHLENSEAIELAIYLCQSKAIKMYDLSMSGYRPEESNEFYPLYQTKEISPLRKSIKSYREVNEELRFDLLRKSGISEDSVEWLSQTKGEEETE